MSSEVKKDLGYYLNVSYGIALRKDEEGSWVAKIEELPGCVAHGDSQAQALENLEDVKTAWIEDAIEAGDPIPEPQSQEELPSGKWLQRVPRFLHKGLTDLAQREGVSLNQLVTTVLAEALGRRKAEHAMILVSHPFEVKGWSAPQIERHHKAHDLNSWRIEKQKPVKFVIDALAAPMFAMPNQLDECQLKVTERVSKTKKELAYES